MGEFLEIRNLTKSFGPVCAVDHVSLSVRRGEFYSLLGPSGCGKTTLLRILAGFEQPDRPDDGGVLLDGQPLLELPPYRRPVNTIFQNYALFPHLSVYENVAFGLRVARRPRAVIAREVQAMLQLVQMGEHAHKRPDQLSGGQKQRVAIARALVNRPSVLLLDEPLAALDLKLRQRMLLELDRIHDEVGITFIYVTHDQTEAVSISDRIAVMNHGRVEQVGTPAEVYEAPKSSFVAAFIGDTNFFAGRVVELPEPDWCRVSLPGFPDVLCYNDNRLGRGDSVHLSVRPEKFQISRDAPAAGDRLNVFEGVVEDVIYQGDRTKFWVRAGGQRIAVSRQHDRFLLDEKPIRWQDHVFLCWHGDDGFMLERFRAGDQGLLDGAAAQPGGTTGGGHGG